MRKRGFGVMGRRLFCVFFLLGSSPNQAACVDAAKLVHSTASIAREFSEEERTSPALIGVRGTGWFLTARVIVTDAHLAEAMHLSTRDWKEVEVRAREETRLLAVRILSMVGTPFERIAVLGPKVPFLGATILPVRTDSLVADEPLISLAYPKCQLRLAGGRFVEQGQATSFPVPPCWKCTTEATASCSIMELQEPR